jgi:hypothetical protein
MTLIAAPFEALAELMVAVPVSVKQTIAATVTGVMTLREIFFRLINCLSFL